MATFSTLTFDLIGNSAQLRTELRRANRSTKDWADKTRAHVNSTVNFMAGSGAAGAAALTAIYTSAATEADKLAKTSDKLGIDPEKLTGFQHAAELTGVSVDTANMALQRMVRRVAEAAQGTGEAQGALEELNIDAEKLAQLSPDEQFKAIADEMGGVGSQSDKVRLAMKLFDSEGVSLVNTLALGSEGLEAMDAEAESLGLTLTRLELAKIESANDAFHKATITTTAFSKSLATEAAPIVEALSNQFVQAAKDAGGFGEISKKMLSGVATSVGFVANAVHGLSVVWDGVKAAAMTSLSAMVSGIAWLDRQISELIDSMPGLSASANQELQSSAEILQEAGENARAEFQNALLEPLPAEKIKEWINEVQNNANEAAKEIADSKVSVNADIDSVVNTGGVAKDYEKDIEQMRQLLLTEEEVLAESYNNRQLIINDAYLSEQISKEKHDALLLQISTKYSNDAAKIAAQQKSATLSNYGQLFDGMAGIAEVSAGKQSAIYKTMFAASKAFAIAESTVAIEQGVANAAKTSWPMNMMAIGSVIAATSSILSTISGTNMDSFEGGGYTGSGSRIGGMDGKGGFMAMLHPNETVIDHTKTNDNNVRNGEGGITNINFTVNAIDSQSFQGAMYENKDMLIGIVVEANNQMGYRSVLGGGF